MSDVNKVKKANDKFDTKLDTAIDHLGIVVDAVEQANKNNTSSKADNIQRGVQDARKVITILTLLKPVVNAIVGLFKKK